MKPKSLSPILPTSWLTLCCLFACLPASQVSAAQVSFVQSPPQRNQQGQQGQQKQQGLSPEKKKSLAKYGPEDAFPGAREQGGNNPSSKRQSSRRSTNPTQPQTTPSPIQTLPPAPVDAKRTPKSSPLPAATQLAAAMQAQSPAGKSSPSTLVPVALAVASLLVLAALIYVVGMLRKRLRGGR